MKFLVPGVDQKDDVFYSQSLQGNATAGVGSWVNKVNKLGKCLV